MRMRPHEKLKDHRDAESPEGPPTVRSERTHVLSTADLLMELGHRFLVRFGRIEVHFHDGRPSPRVMVEHRVQRAPDEADR